MERAAVVRRLGEELIGRARCYIHSHTYSTKHHNSFRFGYKEEDMASEERLWDLYERWRSHYKISRSLTEKQQRFDVFKANLEYIDKVNKMDKPYKLGLNQFSDITDDEFKQHHASFNMLRDPCQETPFTHGRTQNLPASVDWRKNGTVSDIKNQGKCTRKVGERSRD